MTAVTPADRALKEETGGRATLMQIQYVSSGPDGSFCDFALAEPVAINVLPVCPSYVKR